jgi:hypothetical protein
MSFWRDLALSIGLEDADSSKADNYIDREHALSVLASWGIDLDRVQYIDNRGSRTFKARRIISNDVYSNIMFVEFSDTLLLIVSDFKERTHYSGFKERTHYSGIIRPRNRNVGK